MTGHAVDVVRRIVELKRDRDAIILAHNYQRPEVQDIADFTGDSLELSRIAESVTEDVIVFCGVRFMAETAAILCPNKRVLLPVLEAGCALADTATAMQPDDETDDPGGCPAVAGDDGACDYVGRCCPSQRSPCPGPNDGGTGNKWVESRGR